MKKRVEGYIRWLNKMRESRRKSTALILALSLAVSGNVFWFMRGIGTALTDDPSCGMEEHTHTDECYENRLICGYDADVDPSVHVHTDKCYEKVLICNKQEHIHTDACYSSGNLHETPSVWEATIPEITGDAHKDLTNVAMSQLGYSEGENNYSRYGDWYGNPNGEWNVMFISFCLHYSGISEDKIPYGSGCWAWQVKLEEKDLINKENISSLTAGDILFIDNDKDGKCDRCGIVIDIEDDYISVVEGDVNGVTDTVIYSDKDEAIYGSVSTCFETGEDAATEQEETISSVRYSATTESGIEVTASAPAGTFPDDVLMRASDVDNEDIIDQAAQTIDEDKEVKGIVAVDITFTDSEGNEIEPCDGSLVSVTIVLPDQLKLEADEYSLLHIGKDGATELSGVDVSGNGAAFTTDSFSIYVLTGTGEKDKDRVHAYIVAAGMGDMHEYRTEGGNGDNIVNCSDYPYLIKKGETITLIGRVDTGNGEDLHFNYYQNMTWMNTIFSINEISSSPTEVVAEITGLSDADNGGSAALSLYQGTTDLGESFSIRVFNADPVNNVIDFDQIAYGDTPVIHVNYRDTITFMGTPNRYETTYDWPYRDGENKGLLSDFTNYSETAGIRSVTCSADRYIRNDEGQLVSFYTTQGIRSARIVVDYNFRSGNNVNDVIDHADIEIADGGVYTSVSFDIGDDDGLIKTVTEYQSYVYRVNSCRIYNKDINSPNDNPTFFFSKTNSTAQGEEWITATAEPGTVNGFDTDNYWHDPAYIPGDSQYELTSKYIKDPDTGALIYSQKFFLYRDVDHVIFDVGLQIVPVMVEKFKWNTTTGKGKWEKISEEDYNIDYENKNYDKTVDGVTTVTDGDLNDVMDTVDTVFNLGNQYVIDAYNKCPNHTGLDFTVHQNVATVQFGATKELTNGILHEGDFSFDLINEDTNEFVTRVNNAQGKVSFPRLTYETPGTYHYSIREVIGTDSNILYDTSVYRVTVTVSEVPNSGGMLMATVEEYNDNYSFKFINKVKFTLPDTGGTGIAPYMVSGVAIIATSMTLLILRRRKEVDI